MNTYEPNVQKIRMDLPQKKTNILQESQIMVKIRGEAK